MFTSTIIATFKLPLSCILEANVVHSFVNPCYWCNLSIFWWLDPEWRRLLSTSQEQTQGKDHQGQGESAGLQPGPGAFSGLWGASTMTSLQAINITMSDVVQHEHKVLAPFFVFYYLEKEISVLAFCSRLPSRTVRSWSRAAGLVRRWITASSSLWRSRAAILGASKSSRFTISPGQNLMICLNPSGLCASG